MGNQIFYLVGLAIVTFLTVCGIVANGRGKRTVWSTFGQVAYGGMFIACLYAFYYLQKAKNLLKKIKNT